jgi:peptide methionine sulfoxide reductase msrA/msrB
MKFVQRLVIALIIFACSMPGRSIAGNGLEKAIVAGGCFWCVESDFEKISGIKGAISGYTGGTGKSPTYDDYAQKGHIEAVEITYDASVISYEKILDIFWVHVDPTDANGQFCDRGYEYSTGIFYTTDEQKKLATRSKEQLEKSGRLKKPVVTNIFKSGTFYPAEEYHQDYYKKKPIRYKLYRLGCGRDRKLESIWGER